MTEVVQDLVAAGVAAMGRGDLVSAYEVFERAASEWDLPLAHQLLGTLLYADDRLEDARAELEQAFRGFRADGDLRAAAGIASRLGELHTTSLGNVAAGRGWLERARRLLEEVGPCVEWGYWELAIIACSRPDVDDLAASAERALTIARQFNDPGLEVRALADAGLALVTQGHVQAGFQRLDEALATLSAGDVRDVYVVGTSLCSLLSSCDRAGDVDRAAEWIRLVETLLLVPMGGRPRVLGTHCRLAFGSVLCSAGRWGEAEAMLLEALGPAASTSVGHRVEATARLAELRTYQGRIDEAAELLSPIEDSLLAAGPLAAVHLCRGRPDLAAAGLRGAIRQLVGDVLRSGPLVGLLAEAELARHDITAAAEAAALLGAMATAVDAPVITALAAIADGRVALAQTRPADAIASFEDALHHLASGERPLVTATTHLDLALAHVANDDASAAVNSARAAHAAARRLKASALRDRAGALLRQLGVVPPRSAETPSEALEGLTSRELEVLEGMQRGDSNSEIAAALYLSPKTIEHHVGRILAKLGVRTRAEAAVLAAGAKASAAHQG